jgi:acetyl esterase/lipase
VAMFLRAVVLAVLTVGFVVPAQGITRSWTGASSAFWSEPANWSPAGVPAPADSLVFPTGSAPNTMINDLPAGTVVGPMYFARGYTLNGNALTLTGNLTFDQSASPNFVMNAPITLGANVTLGAAITSEYHGAIDVNGFTLTVSSYNTRLVGAVNGTGAISVGYPGITIENGGTFDGTITGTIDIAGSLPGADINGGLTGSGTVGTVTTISNVITGGDPVRPGAKNPAYTSDPHSIGTLSMQSASLGAALYVDLVPGGTSDRLDVTGSVTLGPSSSLLVSIPSGGVSAGQSFTIISNDGGDPVNGTFAGLAEGAQIAVPGGKLAISYAGGDGNDVVLTVAEAKKTWTGAQSALWSNPNNWSPAGIPVSGDPLNFPAGAANTSMTNDLTAGTSVGPMHFGASYTLGGNALTLTGNLTFDQSTYPNFVVDAPLTLAADLTLGAAITSSYNGPIDVAGHTLTIDSYNTAVHELRGTGSINILASGVRIAASGTFDGTINGIADVDGVLPNADFNGGVSGNGTIGALTATGNPITGGDRVSIGLKNPSYGADPHSIGALRTGTLSLSGELVIDLVPGGTSDQLIVTGGVTLGGWLGLSVPSGSISDGQSFVIIENDGNDPVNGTFSGRAEGSTFALGGATLTITYAGGDGNDVVLTAGNATKSWTGAQSALWSNPQNWAPAGAPVAGQDLLFPPGAANRAMTNDLNVTVGALHFADSYTLGGNALTVAGNVTFGDVQSFVMSAPLVLGADVHFGHALTNDFNGAIDVAGHSLTIDSYNTSINGALNGTGAVSITGAGLNILGGGTFAGTIDGVVNVVGSLPGAVISGGLTGDGTVGAVTLTAMLFVGDKNPSYSSDPHTIGTIETQSISLDAPPSTFENGATLYVDVVPGGTSDRLKVTGAVTLGSASLIVSVPSGSPAAGTEFVIVDNDGTDPVSGTFAGLDEQELFTRGPWMFRISYAGGDGNDVVLTAIEPTEVQAEQATSSTQFGETATITVSIVARVGTPTGDVTFTDNGAVIETKPLVSGKATLQTKLEPGVHALAAIYDGTDVFAPSTASIEHVVARGHTTADVIVPGSSTLYGDPVAVNVQVRPIAPATGTPTGDISVAGRTLSLSGGGASASLLLDAGTHEITASYAGDLRFDGSTSNSTFTVAPAPTLTTASVADQSLIVNVSAAHRASLAVTGMITVSENGVVLAQQAADGSSMVVPLQGLSTGDHVLDVSFLGSNNFEASSSSIVFTAGPGQLSIRDVAVFEGDGAKNVTLLVELSAPSPQVVTVSWTTEDSSATSGTDYEAASGTITFAPGELTKTIAIALLGDTKPESDEMLIVRLSSPVNAAVAGGTAGVKIVNDDLSYRVQSGLAYAPGLTLDLYTPTEGAGPFPLILWVPGTTSYDAAGGPPEALRETGRGYAVAVVRYRTPAVAKFPAQLHDLRDAVRWLRGNAVSLKIETTRIAAWGTLAGAHLASLLGTANEAGEGGALSSAVQAVVASGGLSDLTLLQSDAVAAGCAGAFDDRNSVQSQLIGCALPACAQLAAAASPLRHVTPGDVPFLILQTRNDCLVPAAQSTRFYNALRAAGVKATLLTVDPGSVQGHDPIDAFLDAQLHARGGKRRVVN